LDCRRKAAHDPIGVTVRQGGQELYHDRLDFALEERVRHVG